MLALVKFRDEILGISPPLVCVTLGKQARIKIEWVFYAKCLVSLVELKLSWGARNSKIKWEAIIRRGEEYA